MKNNCCFLIIVLTLFLFSCNRQPKFKTINEGLNHCTSVYEMNDTLLIANLGSSDPFNSSDPTGYIMQVVGDSVFPLYIRDSVLYSPKEMIRIGNYLYVSDVCRVHAINMTSQDHKVTTIPLSNFDSHISDLEVVGDMLLLSSTSADKILAMELNADGSPEQKEFQLYIRVPCPTAMEYYKGKLFIASSDIKDKATSENVIYVVDDFIYSQPKPFIKRIGKYMGLAIKDDFLYFIDCNINKIGKISINNSEMIEFLEKMPQNNEFKYSKIYCLDDCLCVLDMGNSNVFLFKE